MRGAAGPAVAVRGGMHKTLAFAVLTTVLAVSSSIARAEPAPVVGGSTVTKGAWPDAVAVLAQTAACTGTLIAPDVVLTAGHCIEVSPVEVIVDSVDYAQRGGEVIRVKSATAYPDWQHAYDVGVLVLEHPAAAKPRAIASPCTAKELVVDAKVRVVGFGLTTQAGTGDNTKLHQAMLTVTDPTCAGDPSCAAAIAPAGEFMAGGDGKDACFGDSGGPIYLGDALIGVVSRGVASAGKPCGGGGIYVRADTVAGWIEHVTKRKLTRASCDKADGDGDATASDGGCAATGGAGLPVAFAGLAGLAGIARVRRRRRA